ncbi:RNA-directed DNA polymerase, eukaryota, nucleotide-binding alpha-beta plait domain protein [Tanacetum coccineum]
MMISINSGYNNHRSKEIYTQIFRICYYKFRTAAAKLGGGGRYKIIKRKERINKNETHGKKDSAVKVVGQLAAMAGLFSEYSGFPKKLYVAAFDSFKKYGVYVKNEGFLQVRLLMLLLAAKGLLLAVYGGRTVERDNFSHQQPPQTHRQERLTNKNVIQSCIGELAAMAGLLSEYSEFPKKGKAVCILAWQLTKVAAMADVFLLRLPRSRLQKIAPHSMATSGSTERWAAASLSESHPGIEKEGCEEGEMRGRENTNQVTNLTKLTEAQTDEIVLAEKEEIHKVTDLRSKLKSGTVNLENQDGIRSDDLNVSHFQSKEDQTRKISHSIFVTNFPDSVNSRELWRVCSVYGMVVDVFIPSKKSMAGKRFAFVRFIKVPNVDRLVENLCSHCTNARARSYANIVNGASVGVNITQPPALVLDDSCLVEHDLSKHVMGKLKDFSSFPNLSTLLLDEGFSDVHLSYLGGMWVMLEFETEDIKKNLMVHTGINSWFDVIQDAETDFVSDERIVWVDIEGVPLKAWSRETFTRIAKKWGEMLELEDNADNSFGRKRICIKTKNPVSILESFKIIVKGKIFMVRAKELFTWNPSFVVSKERSL